MNLQDKERILSICRRAQNEVKTALDALSKAKNWGIFDLLGGGLISSFVKRSRMREVEDHVARIHRVLSELDHELAEVKFTGFDQSIGRIAFDLYFDNIITDFRVLGEIDKAQSELEILQARLHSLEQDLKKS